MTKTLEFSPALRDSDGNPVGNLKPIKPPNGVPESEWRHIIELAVGNFRLTAGMGYPDRKAMEALDIDEVVSKKSWDLIYKYEHNRTHFEGALGVRGVLPLGSGLSAEQSMAIEILSDPHYGVLKTRIRKAGITPATFEKWMLHEPFQKQLSLLAQRRMNSSKSLVDIQLTAQAVEGQMDAIRYFDKRVGRDPDKVEAMDGRKVIDIVVDVMTKYLTDQPELLRQMAAELEVRTKLHGDVHN